MENWTELNADLELLRVKLALVVVLGSRLIPRWLLGGQQWHLSSSRAPLEESTVPQRASR